MSSNKNLTWSAIYELGDYFSRLSGSARPLNMAESEIHLYISYKLLDLNNVDIDKSTYSNSAFLEAAKPIIEKVNQFLSEVNLSRYELFPFVHEFYKFMDEKLQVKDKTKRWHNFGEYLVDRQPISR